LAGDAALREAARRMQNSVRQYDSIGRYGGEEFLILLPGCGEVESYAQADRLRKMLAQTDMSAGDTSIHVTASFGVTTALPGESWTQEALIRSADEALYVAKKSGRNRVEFLACTPEVAAVSGSAVVVPSAR
jgi:two-component system cell cycle response regulator